MSTAPTDGPTDTNTSDVINKIIFPGEPTRPPIQFIRDQPIPVFSKGLYYTNPGLLHQAVIPITNDRDQLMRVWCLDFLQAVIFNNFMLFCSSNVARGSSLRSCVISMVMKCLDDDQIEVRVKAAQVKTSK